MMKISLMSTLKCVGLLWLSATVAIKSTSSSSPVPMTTKPTTTTTPPPPRYQPTWESLESRPLPTWFDQEKIGIFIHWGVFSTIGLGEWFWYNWKVYQQPDKIKYMNDNFKPNFTYQDFGRDFTAELFNATEWSLLFKNSGARYVVLTSKHHEGYTLWPSKYSFSWNSVDVGPHKDLVGELAASLRKHTDIRFGLYHSLYEWFNRLYLDDKRNNFTTRRFPEMKTMPELYELVETYCPEIIWSDGEWEANDEYWQSKEFLAWLYNDSPVKNTVVVNDRWGSNTLCKHGGFLTCQDRYNPKDKQTRKWENAMTIDKKTWGFRKDANLEDFLTSKELIQLLIETVSAGGNLLVNVAPTGYGKIPPIFEERLSDMGKWLSVNGKAIYGSRPWKVCLNDTVNPNVWYTEGVNSEIYALFSNWPRTGTMILKCLKTLSNSAVIEFVGLGTEVNWILVNDTIEIVLPNKAFVTSSWAWTLKVVNGTDTER